MRGKNCRRISNFAIQNTDRAFTCDAGGPRVIATTKVYSQQGVVSFVQTFPDGLVNASANHLWSDVKNGVSSIFPALQPRSLPGGLSANRQRRWMAYNGWDW